MKPISYKRRRFPPDVLRHAVWRYARFSLSLREVEDLLAERGIEVSYEAAWTLKFREQVARNLRRSPGGVDECDRNGMKLRPCRWPHAADGG